MKKVKLQNEAKLTSLTLVRILVFAILLIECLGVSYAQPSTDDVTAPYAMRMPFRGDSLPINTYIRSGGHDGYGPPPGGAFALDFGAVKYDTKNSKWLRTPSGEFTSNEEIAIFDAVLYAPEDGEVVACWRNAPERNRPGEGYDFDGDGEFDEGAPSGGGSGNALYIRNKAGTHIINLAHMKQHSIPPHLCPHNTRDDWLSSKDSGCVPSEIFSDGIPRALRLDTPVPVKAGERIGRVGNSGRSGGPHLHMGVKPFFVEGDGDLCQAAGVEMLFAEAWDQPYNSAQGVQPWNALQEHINFPQFGPSQLHLFWPDTISSRLNHNRLDSASNLELAVKSGRSYVAYRTSMGALEIALFRNSDLEVLDTASIADISEFAAAASPGNTLATALRDGQGRLAVISWSGTTDQLQRRETYRGGAIGFVEAASSQRGVYVAYQRSNTTIGVAEFEIQTDASLTLAGLATRGTAISDIAITEIRDGRFTTDPVEANSFDGAVTLDRRASDGAAVIRSWNHSNDMNHADGVLCGYEMAANSALSISRIHGSGRELVVAAGRDTAGDLRIQTWAVSVDGNLSLLDEAILSGVSDVSVAGVTTKDFVTAVRSSGKARLVSWSHSNGRNLRRKGTVVATSGDDIGELDIGARLVAGSIFAGVRDAQGKLTLLQHKVNFDPAF